MIARIKIYSPENSIFKDFCLFNDVKHELVEGTDDYRIYNVEYDNGYLLYLMGRYMSVCDSIKKKNKVC